MAALRPGRLCRRPLSGARVIERRTPRVSHRSVPLPLLTDSLRSRASFARRPGFSLPPAFPILFSTLPIRRVHLAPLLVTRLPTTLLVARAPSSRAARSHLTRLDSRYRVHLDVPSGRPAERVPAVPRKLYSRQEPKFCATAFDAKPSPRRDGLMWRGAIGPGVVIGSRDPGPKPSPRRDGLMWRGAIGPGVVIGSRDPGDHQGCALL